MILPSFHLSDWRKPGLFLSGIVWCALQIWKISSAGQCPPPRPLNYELLREVKRSKRGFTQGFVHVDGWLYESTGGFGDSELRKIDPESGKVEILNRLPGKFFGEGLESKDEVLYQLTWTDRKLLRWDQQGRLLGQTAYPYEGWGLTLGSHGVWISSDGSSNLRFFGNDPGNYEWTAEISVPVRKEGEPVEGLNELEFGNGRLYANIFGRDEIVEIDQATGCVIGELDLSELSRRAGIDPEDPKTVMNGIAYRDDRRSLYVTGKNWPSIFEIRLKD